MVDDYAWLELGVEGQRILDTRGEGPGVRELMRAIRGLCLLEAARVPGEPLALDALHAALGERVAAQPAPARVAVAMSGGLDSAMALRTALDEGLDPVGVTLRLWLDPHAANTEKACCSPASVRAARELCHEHGVAHVTLDLRERFHAAVVEPFVRGYAAGVTPNPCVRCNGEFRFHQLDRFARRIGASRLATGHYARIVERGHLRLLARARDVDKDQSYMLASLAPPALGRLWFPLGDTLKRDNRERALQLGLDAARRAESQEACFLGGSDYRDFLERNGVRDAPGSILDESGRELGTHRGAWRFTPGQRKGLGLSGGDRARYVLRTDVRARTVHVGRREALTSRRVQCVPGVLHTRDARGEAKLRFRSPAVPASVRREGTGFVLELDDPVEAVAPGQLAALYVDDAVVGSGTIVAAAQA